MFCLDVAGSCRRARGGRAGEGPAAPGALQQLAGGRQGDPRRGTLLVAEDARRQRGLQRLARDRRAQRAPEGQVPAEEQPQAYRRRGPEEGPRDPRAQPGPPARPGHDALELLPPEDARDRQQGQALLPRALGRRRPPSKARAKPPGTQKKAKAATPAATPDRDAGEPSAQAGAAGGEARRQGWPRQAAAPSRCRSRWPRATSSSTAACRCARCPGLGDLAHGPARRGARPEVALHQGPHHGVDHRHALGASSSATSTPSGRTAPSTRTRSCTSSTTRPRARRTRSAGTPSS